MTSIVFAGVGRGGRVVGAWWGRGGGVVGAALRGVTVLQEDQGAN